MTIFLVEDEEYALQSLSQKIVDLGGPYEIIGSAYDGLGALEKLEARVPDILITDIRMPDMDGIALIERVRALYPDTICVIVSGFQQFDYAKTAMRLGVTDYLLKPVAPDELRQTLAQCATEVERRRNSRHMDEVLTVETARWGNTPSYILYMVFGNALSGLSSIIHPGGLYIPSRDIEDRLHTIDPSIGSIFCFLGMCSNEKAVIIERGAMPPQALEQSLYRLAAEVERAYGCALTVSYQAMEREGIIGQQIDLCRKRAVRGVLPGISTIFCEPPEYSGPSDMRDSLADIALYARRERIDLLTERLRDLASGWQANRYQLFAILNDLFYIVNFFRDTFSATEFDLPMLDSLDSILSISTSYTDLADNFAQLLAESLNMQPDPEPDSAQRLVEDIERYFLDNLSNNISLSMLCREMNYSKVYLCRVFKNTKNTTPIDYFIRLKIEKAQTLLRQSPATPLKDIAESLGFSDVYYFSKVFKRITGHAPSSVRQMG